ncbi:MAG: helix-turn-helix domain-containing protein [Streptosporangiaceae bacterium]
MDVVGEWTGHHAKTLRKALRLTAEDFAHHLGVSVRAVAGWDQQPAKVPAPLTQQLLDTALDRASDPEKARFALLMEDAGGPDPRPTRKRSEAPVALGEREPGLGQHLALARQVDASIVELLRDETHNLRLGDRRIGAQHLLARTSAHVTHLVELMKHAIMREPRDTLAQVLTEAATLGGWQALDLGLIDKAWSFYETAKLAARETGQPHLIAHAMAEQAYVLTDLDRADEARALVDAAINEAGRRSPAVVTSWLHAARGEASAIVGDLDGCQAALDEATRLLPADAPDPSIPFVTLNEAHLARWRGNCLARFGDPGVIDDLQYALSGIEGFTRAEAGLRADLAMALRARSEEGDQEAAGVQLAKASELALATGSARQQRRIARLREAP